MTKLTELPNELLENIVRQMPDIGDKSRFSRTSRHLYEVAKPELFRSLTIHTQQPRTASSALVAGCRLGGLVRELVVLMGRTKADGDWNTFWPFLDYYKVDQEIWYRSSAYLFALLRGSVPYEMPRLQTVKIEFPDYHTPTLEHLYGRTPVHRVGYQVWQMIEDRPNKLLKTIAELPTSPITDLRISNLPPLQRGNPLRLPAWWGFLRKLKRFELSLYSDTEDPHHTSSANPFFRHFVANLEGWVFSQLASAEYVKLTGSIYGMIGQDFSIISPLPAIPLPFEPESMPRLSALHLDTIVVDHSFVNWLAGRSASSPPLKINLTNVMCSDYHLVGRPHSSCLKWHEVFDKMTQLVDGGTRIQSLTILVREEWRDSIAKRVFTLQGLQRVGELLLWAASNPRRTMFPYVHIGPFGHLVDNLDMMKEAFLAKKDQRQYDRLLRRIKEYNEKAA